MKKLFVFLAIIGGCILLFNNIKIFNVNETLNNVIKWSEQVTENIKSLQHNDLTLTNKLDTISNKIEKLEEKISSISNKQNEMKDEINMKIDVNSNWNYYRQLDNINNYYVNMCNISSTSIKLYNNTNCEMILRMNDAPNNKYNVTIALTNGNFKFVNGRCKVFVNFNNGFTSTLQIFEAIKFSDRLDVALITHPIKFVNNVKKVNKFTIRTSIYNEIEQRDFNFYSDSTLDETTL